ncbi:hypothetical protein SCP_0600860 [Sparassis crispa]|uniref:Uncharacterized protein n=1 Tax=Sparassis crispa TaxID=139825 RepID=A0A401GPG4_9APHY|nr:hypothetical protein SCP_0600860 [Sparassis crispa]GBE84108.1 hypothetical protein SCP_0600860 [Sparassis crispa]
MFHPLEVIHLEWLSSTTTTSSYLCVFGSGVVISLTQDTPAVRQESDLTTSIYLPVYVTIWCYDRLPRRKCFTFVRDAFWMTAVGAHGREVGVLAAVAGNSCVAVVFSRL